MTTFLHFAAWFVTTSSRAHFVAQLVAFMMGARPTARLDTWGAWIATFARTLAVNTLHLTFLFAGCASLLTIICACVVTHKCTSARFDAFLVTVLALATSTRTFVATV